MHVKIGAETKSSISRGFVQLIELSPSERAMNGMVTAMMSSAQPSTSTRGTSGIPFLSKVDRENLGDERILTKA